MSRLAKFVAAVAVSMLIGAGYTTAAVADDLDGGDGGLTEVMVGTLLELAGADEVCGTAAADQASRDALSLTVTHESEVEVDWCFDSETRSYSTGDVRHTPYVYSPLVQYLGAFDSISEGEGSIVVEFCTGQPLCFDRADHHYSVRAEGGAVTVAPSGPRVAGT